MPSSCLFDAVSSEPIYSATTQSRYTYDHDSKFPTRTYISTYIYVIYNRLLHVVLSVPPQAKLVYLLFSSP